MAVHLFRQFTDTALGFSMTILNSLIDLVSFSEILYSIYPPLFLALLVYSIGGTATSLFLGRKLVGLNFEQEVQEANFRQALVASGLLALGVLYRNWLVLHCWDSMGSQVMGVIFEQDVQEAN